MSMVAKQTPEPEEHPRQRWATPAAFATELARRYASGGFPPYVDISPWVHKAIAEVARVDGPEVVVMLLPNRGDQAWFHDLSRGAELVVHVQGRVQFEPPPGWLRAATQARASWRCSGRR